MAGETLQTLVKGVLGRKPIGLVEEGNINLADRKPAYMPDGSIATVHSMSFNDGGPEILIPTVVDGRVVSADEAIQHYYQTGEHLGKFNTPRAATRYAKRLHRDQARRYVK